MILCPSAGLNMRYYLETNAIRALSRRVRDLSVPAKRTVFTSSLAVFEIVSGLNEDNYAERAAIVANLSKSKLPIDWRSPGQLIANAFKQSRPTDPITWTTHQVWFAVTSSTSFAETMRACEQHRPPIDLAGLIASKGELSRIYSTARLQQMEDYRDQLRSEPLKTLMAEAGLGPVSKRKELIEEVAAELDQKLLDDVAAKCAMELAVVGTQKAPADLLSKYDGSLDHYIQASRWLQLESMLFQNPSGENDAPDVLHFLYVDKETQMVSNDALSKRISGALWPNRLISIEDLRNKFTLNKLENR